jgi:hypothetical protein
MIFFKIIICGENQLEKTNKECTFSIELNSKDKIKKIKVANNNNKDVLIEGSIGKLQHTEFIEDIVLEVVGEEGNLRIDLSPEQIERKNWRSYKNENDK